MFKVLLVIVTAFGCSSHPFVFGSQRRGKQSKTKEHNSYDTVTLRVVYVAIRYRESIQLSDVVLGDFCNLVFQVFDPRKFSFLLK